MPTVKELFAEELDKHIPVFFGDRESVVYTPLEDDEKAAIQKVFNYGLAQLRRISPKIASDIEPQLSLALKVAGIFKDMIPEKKSYAFPSQTGSLGVAWLFPQAIKYAATPSATSPCYTSYGTNSWDISLTAGTAAYLFGDGTNYYKSSPTTGQHSALLVFNNGILEIGSTPKVEQFRLIAEGFTKYGIYTVAPIVEERIEENRLIYQYPTPLGATPIFYDKGIMWGFMPRVSGTATIKLLGLVFYEHDFAASLKWVS
jgi:hypothetical protein